MKRSMRSKLFVPASRPELFSKAMASAADAISFDLEDAVEEGRKPAARAELAVALAQRGAWSASKIIVVRVNAITSAHFSADMQAVVLPGLDIVNLPMVDGPDEVRSAVEMLTRFERERQIATPIGILANIESPRGLRHAAEIAAADARVMGLQIGFGDLFGPLGIDPMDEAASQAIRLAVRLAAGESGVDAYDGAYPDIGNPAGFEHSAQLAARMGFAGKSCIHPTQIALANGIFKPSAEELAHAQRVVEAARLNLAQGVGAFVVDGKLCDGPLITRAEEIVAQAARLR